MGSVNIVKNSTPTQQLGRAALMRMGLGLGLKEV
jgi:hypothetical protein